LLSHRNYIKKTPELTGVFCAELNYFSLN